ncbi:MAG: DUF6089 family protein [Flavobacteriales bacterium]
MKKHLRIILTYHTLWHAMNARRHEIVAFLGGSNFIGDIGPANYIVPNHSVFMVLYRYNLTSRYSIHLFLMRAGIWNIDREASEQYQKNRVQSIQNHLGEVSILFEFDFFNFNHTHKIQNTPFIFARIGLVGYQNKTYVLDYRKLRDANGMPIESKSSTNSEKIDTSKNVVRLSYAISFGIGYRYNFFYNWVIIDEIGIRITGTGNIDYKTPNILYIIERCLEQEPYQAETRNQSRDFLNEKTFGNVRSKDWCVSSGLSLMYAFG